MENLPLTIEKDASNDTKTTCFALRKTCHDIPTLGIKHSRPGNEMFPGREWIKANDHYLLFCLYVLDKFHVQLFDERQFDFVIRGSRLVPRLVSEILLQVL